MCFVQITSIEFLATLTLSTLGKGGGLIMPGATLNLNNVTTIWTNAPNFSFSKIYVRKIWCGVTIATSYWQALFSPRNRKFLLNWRKITFSSFGNLELYHVICRHHFAMRISKETSLDLLLSHCHKLYTCKVVKAFRKRRFLHTVYCIFTLSNEVFHSVLRTGVKVLCKSCT